MKKIYYIKWMHCIACEMLIEKEIEDIKWLKVLSLTHKTWKVELEYQDEKSFDKFKEILKKNNYSLEEQHNKKNQVSDIYKNTFLDYVVIVLLFILFWLVYFLFSNSDLIKYFPSIWTDVSILTSFFVWVWASLSTCLALLWWIVVWLSTYESWSFKSISDRLNPQVSFHFWRIISYIILWWLLWQLWSLFALSWKINWFVTIFISAIILYIWLQMLNVVPSITKLWLYLPKSMTKSLDHNSKMWPFFIWVFTFFIPCWFTQAMQIASIASWSFLKWAMIMWMFALWTMPVLVWLWIMSSYSKDKNYSILKKIIWVVIIMFALIWISNSSSLLSFSNNNKSLAINNESIVDEKIEEVSVSHNWSSTVPSEIKIKPFKKYNLSIMPESNWLWCMTTILIPWVDENIYRVVKWEKITFNIPQLSPWSYKLVCSAMWMTHWTLIVE